MVASAYNAWNVLRCPQRGAEQLGGARRSHTSMANQAYTQFLLDPNTAARQADFGAFVGPNVNKFLPAYQRQWAAANRPPGEKVKMQWGSGGFNAGAFFGGPIWFFYRKMWAWAWGLTVALLLIGLIPGTSRIGLPVGIGLALGANPLYVSHAINKIVKMRAAGHASVEEIQRAGGVSKVAGWVAGVIYGLLVALTIYSLFTLGPDAIR